MLIPPGIDEKKPRLAGAVFIQKIKRNHGGKCPPASQQRKFVSIHRLWILCLSHPMVQSRMNKEQRKRIIDRHRDSLSAVAGFPLNEGRV